MTTTAKRLARDRRASYASSDELTISKYITI